jgi:hypothetical protein
MVPNCSGELSPEVEVRRHRPLARPGRRPAFLHLGRCTSLSQRRRGYVTSISSTSSAPSTRSYNFDPRRSGIAGLLGSQPRPYPDVRLAAEGAAARGEGGSDHPLLHELARDELLGAAGWVSQMLQRGRCCAAQADAHLDAVEVQAIGVAVVRRAVRTWVRPYSLATSNILGTQGD